MEDSESSMNNDQLTAGELSLIEELKDRVRDILGGHGIAAEYASEPFTLWRYVLAKSQDPNPMEESENMFRRSVAWRETIGLSELCQEWQPLDEASESISPMQQKWKSARARLGNMCFYGGILSACSVNGGPVLVERLGSVDLPGLYRDEHAFSCVEKSYIIHLENVWKLVRATGNKTRGIIIIDIADAGWSTLGYVSVIKRISESGILMFPEINERVTIVNSGWFMSTLWSAVKPFIPKRSEQKIRILNSSFQEDVFPDITGGAASLPDFLAGSLSAEEHRVCPAMKVDEAYDLIVNDIINRTVFYPDSKEFLEAAIVHSSQFGDSTHELRIAKIRDFLGGLS